MAKPFFSYKKSFPVQYLIKSRFFNSPSIAFAFTFVVSLGMLAAAGAIAAHAMEQQSSVKFVEKYQPIDQRAFRASVANKNMH